MKTPKWFDKLRNRGMTQATPPIIPTQYGPVTESARLAAAMNMRGSREIRERVGDSLRCSIGLAPNRMLAKVAADMKKPMVIASLVGRIAR